MKKTPSTKTRHDAVKSEETPSYHIISASEEKILAKARKILELRMLREHDALTDPRMVRDYLTMKLADLEHEVFGMVLLDNRNCVITTAELFRGTIDGASVYPREVIKEALKHNAAAIIFYHNHPSGNEEPSTADERITDRLKKALTLVDIRVLDHIIVGGLDITSFAERGLI